MNNSLTSLKVGIVLWLSAMGLVSLMGQDRLLQFDQAPLQEVFQALEKNSPLVFNFDPQLLAQYQFSGSITPSDDAIDQILFHTPLAYQREEQTILLYLPPPGQHRRCGRVVDQETGMALPFASIALLDSQQGVLTNEEGYFEFDFKGYKNQQIRISYLGYVAHQTMIQKMDSSDCPAYPLAIDLNMMTSEIIVKDYLLNGITEGGSYSENHLNYSQLNQQHSLVEQDVLKTVQLLPGVNSVDESAGNIQIRGGTSDHQLILWEGTPLYGSGHIFGMVSSINPFVVDQVKVFKGVSEPSYDQRVGGVIDISLNDSLPEQWHGGLGSTFSEAHGYVQVPIVSKKLSVLASGRKTLYNLFQSPTLNSYTEKVFQSTRVDDESDNPSSNQVLDYEDWNAKLLFRPTKNILFKASWLQSYNEFNFTAELIEDEITTRDDVISNTEAISLSLHTTLRPKWQQQIQFSRSLYDNNALYEIFNLEEDRSSIFNLTYNDIADHQFSLQNDFLLSKTWNMQLGYIYNQKEVNLNLNFESDFEEAWEDIYSQRGRFHNIFGAFQHQKKDLLINLGWRSTYYQESESWAFSPRLNLQYALNQQVKLKVSAGILQQYVSQLKEFGDNELAQNNQIWVLNGFEEEELQEAKKLSGGLVFQRAGWLVDVEAYYNRVDGLSTLSPAFRGQGNVFGFSTGHSINTGMDLLVRKRWRQFNCWLNYSLSRGIYNFPELAERDFPASNDQRHQLSLITNWQYKKWTFSLTYQYRSGLPFSQAVDVIQEFDEQTNETYYEILYGDFNRQRLDYYSRLDVGIRFMPQFKKSRIKTEFALQWLNLLNRENILSRHFFLEDIDQDTNSPEIYPLNKVLLLRTPQVLIRMYW
ncbi:MAG: carboxypeptidase-like regulatory domain-containing protein [Bacteroidota bacterium]